MLRWSSQRRGAAETPTGRGGEAKRAKGMEGLHPLGPPLVRHPGDVHAVPERQTGWQRVNGRVQARQHLDKREWTPYQRSQEGMMLENTAQR